MQVQSGLRAKYCDSVGQCAPVRTARSSSSGRRKQRCVQLRATTDKTSKKSSYPEEELEIDGFLPLRKPGTISWISTSPRAAAPTDANIWRSLRSQHARAGAFPSVASATHDESITSGSSSEEAPFDPLRDGPLRYLGYANECG